MGKSKSSSSNTTNNYDQSQNANFENVQKAMNNSVDNSTTNYNYNLASDNAIGNLSNALQTQAAQTAEAVTTQKNVTNEIVNSLQSTAKTNTVMISTVAATALIGGAYVLSKRKR
ncbi:MAG: hypothetical protein LBT96_05410 [Campylobacteraceae bacterium]|jgi:translation initiation factor 2 alpha subunit (eIF-2alpha)|nr:hypothetical protein [Campylobacteraceae bacterium]